MTNVASVIHSDEVDIVGTIRNNEESIIKNDIERLALHRSSTLVKRLREWESRNDVIPRARGGANGGAGFANF